MTFLFCCLTDYRGEVWNGGFSLSGVNFGKRSPLRIFFYLCPKNRRKPMRYYVIAGEASGDLHASNLIKGLRKFDTDAEVRGWGGDLMRDAGCDIVRHYKDTAIMGFLTVLKNLDKIKANIEACHQDILAWRPDVVILVDYGGFNLRVAKFIKEAKIPVFYYISPKIWAWNTGRVKKIKRLVDRMFVIFPFEVNFYAQYDYPRCNMPEIL